MRRMLSVCAVLTVIAGAATATTVPTLIRHPLDTSESRTFTLKNRLKVLLISDAKFNKSAAALDLAAGSFQDPKDRQGMAHFTEHMLFINTKKYPEVDAFNRFLTNNGGYRNGFTAAGNTNYHFEVHHEVLEEALDRFAQFFVAPLFDSAYAEREMHAIDSEHKKNIMNDSRREYQLYRSFCKKDHPMSMFSTGDLVTLKGTGSKELKDFYRTHSSANRMSLTVLGTQGLDELERMVRASFEAVPDNNLPPISYSAEYLDQIEAVRVIKMIPVKELRQLSIDFALPDLLAHYASKPARMLGTCIGHEGQGSLLSYLKEQGWATGLRAGGYPYCSSFAAFSITVSLTEKGLTEYSEVLKACFSYIELLKSKGISKHIFEESAAMAQLDYANSDPGEGASRASRTASAMNRYPLDIVQEVPFMFVQQDTVLEKKILGYLRPNNMICILTAQGQKTDAKEKYYGTEYAYTEDKELYSSLVKPVIIKALQMPVRNPYVPRAVHLLPEQPITLIKEKGAHLWYSQDTEFKRPKVRIEINYQVPEKMISLKHLVLLDFYAACINEQLNELAYPATEAGLYYSLSGNGRGVSLKVGGYDGAALQLLDSIAVQLKTIALDQERFAGIQDRIVRRLNNFDKDPAYRIARVIARKVRKGTYFLPQELVATAQAITLKEVQTFTKLLYKQGHIWGMVHGNISAPASIDAFRRLQGRLAVKPLSAKQVFRQSILAQPKPETLTFADTLVTNNSCFWRFNMLGLDTPRLRAAAKIINNYIDPLVFTTLRTNQQLGYIVHGGATRDLDQLYLIFLLQSADYNPVLLREKTAAFIQTIPDSFAAISDDAFSALKKAVAENLQERPKSINERGASLATLAFDYNEDFGRRQKELEALATLDKAAITALLNEALRMKSAKITDFLLFAKQHKEALKGVGSLQDINTFKQGREYRYETN